MFAIFRDIPIEKLLPQYVFNILTTSELVALPLFVIMGEFLFRTRLSQALFNGLAPWMGLLPGRLLHVNIVGCSIFAAISGSSAATTQVVGRISLTELLRRGYSRDIAIGSLAGAGTLGFLIPPSTVMIIYGVLAEESVLRLFTAGFIPGFLLAGCFMAMIMVRTTMRPDMIPESERQLRHVSMGERIRALKELGPAIFLILCVLGSMYGGHRHAFRGGRRRRLRRDHRFRPARWIEREGNPRCRTELHADLQHDRHHYRRRDRIGQCHVLPRHRRIHGGLRRRFRSFTLHADRGVDGRLSHPWVVSSKGFR